MTGEHSTSSGQETGDGRQPGTRLGWFELREPLGAGAMGQVWKGWESVNKQGLPDFKSGGDYRYREVDAWLESQRHQLEDE